MGVTFGSYGKTPRTRTIRGAAPCGSWFAHSPAKRFAGGYAAGVGVWRLCVGLGAGRESVCAYGLEDSRWLYQRRDHLNCADVRWLSLVGHGIWLASLRWRSRGSMAASGWSAATRESHYLPVSCSRRRSLDRHDGGAGQLERRYT